jgi:linear primary-alkylsulfatase
MMLDFLAVRLDGERAAGKTLTLDLTFPDFRETHRVRLRNSVIVHEAEAQSDSAAADAKLTMNRAVFLQVAFAGAPLEPQLESGAIRVEGDAAALPTLLGLLDTFTPDFAIVTP